MLMVAKYPIGELGELKTEMELELPRGARVLAFAQQHGIYCVWAMVNPESPAECRRFVLAGTGHSLDAYAWDLRHIDTVLPHGGSLVLHFFECA